MAKKKSFSIGASLQQAFGDTVNAAKNHSGELHIEIIPLRKIELDPENPRDLSLNFVDLQKGISKEDSLYDQKTKEYESLKSMAHSIREQGLINPIFVYKYGQNYRLITGERRTLASIIAQKEDIQAKVLENKPDLVRLSVLQWIENIEREDLTLWERFRNLEKIVDSYAKQHSKDSNQVTATDLSHLIGCSLQQALNYKNILDGSLKVKNLIKDNKIRNLEKAALVARTTTNDLQEQLINACLAGATLKQMKTIAKQQTSRKKEIPKRNQGRQATKVNFGSTPNLSVARIILSSILNTKQINHLENKLQIRWDNYKSITEAFKKVIDEIEKIETANVGELNGN